MARPANKKMGNQPVNIYSILVVRTPPARDARHPFSASRPAPSEPPDPFWDLVDLEAPAPATATATARAPAASPATARAGAAACRRLCG